MTAKSPKNEQLVETPPPTSLLGWSAWRTQFLIVIPVPPLEMKAFSCDSAVGPRYWAWSHESSIRTLSPPITEFAPPMMLHRKIVRLPYPTTGASAVLPLRLQSSSVTE